MSTEDANLRDQALAYAVESRKSHFEASAVVDAAKEFYAFLSDSVTKDVVTEDSETRREVTKDSVLESLSAEKEGPSAEELEKIAQRAEELGA